MKAREKTIYEIPASFLDQMAVLLGDEYPAFLSSLNLPSLCGLRANTLKITSPQFNRLSPWKLSPVEWCSCGFLVETSPENALQSQPGKHPFHAAGLYYLQEPSAMAAAEILAPQPGEKVLDVAAAPGGKTTHLAALMNNTGLLVANEIHPRRVWDLVENLERCGVTNAVVMNETPERLADHFGEYFDRVLLDAPCSGEGMFRRGAVARQEWKPGLPRSCAIRQAGILEQAARLVKPGGRLAYTTCTFSPEENEAVVSKFLSKHPEFDLLPRCIWPGFRPARPDWVGLPADDRLQRCVRIWPHLAHGEGHFIALLGKQDRPNSSRSINHIEKNSARGKKRSRSQDASLIAFESFVTDNLNITFDRSHLAEIASHVYYLPELKADLSGLRVIRPGWWLGTLRKGYFFPSHAFAMGIKSDYAQQRLCLEPGETRLLAYIEGQILADPGKDGWVLLTLSGFPIGWGKRVQDRLKNYYPKGMRKSMG